MQLIFRPEAQQELLAAQAWYEARSPGLGFEFARAVDVGDCSFTAYAASFSAH